MNIVESENAYEIRKPGPEVFFHAGAQLLGRIDEFKNKVRRFYYEVILSQYRCPECSGNLFMTGASTAKCQSCGSLLDPTLSFQYSPCCNSEFVDIINGSV